MYRTLNVSFPRRAWERANRAFHNFFIFSRSIAMLRRFTTVLSIVSFVFFSVGVASATYYSAVTDLGTLTGTSTSVS